MNTHIPPEPPLLQWSATSAPRHERTTQWYVIAWTLDAFFFLYSIVTHAWSFTLVIVMATLVYWQYHRMGGPMEFTMRIWNDGVAIENEFVPWKLCSGYWFRRTRHFTELHIERTGVRSHIIIQTGHVSVVLLRRLLGAHISEIPDRGSAFVDKLGHFCKI